MAIKKLVNVSGLALGAMVFVCSCSPISKRSLTKQFKETEAKFQDHVGFAFYDLDLNKSVFEYNSDKYFTPASNTKIFTLYTGLKIIGDSIPALKYQVRSDSLIFEGTGDPSFLYDEVFQSRKTYDFLQQSDKNLYYSDANAYITRFGPGWSWEDYDFDFSVERNAFPIYGNRTKFQYKEGELKSGLKYFDKYVTIGKSDSLSSMSRDWSTNTFRFYEGSERKEKKFSKPFVIDSLLIPALLEDTLQRQVVTINKSLSGVPQILYSVHADSLYKVMMVESDNFIAEQLLLVCSSILGDSINSEIPLRYMMNHYLNDLPDKPIIKDGSGLSRYNLVTPRTVVSLWKKLYAEVPQDRLFKILATGGKSGTLKNNYKEDEPYIFGKTGTLSNVHCLSGFLVTKRKRMVIFSYMNTNFTQPTRNVRSEMEVLLKKIHDNY